MALDVATEIFGRFVSPAGVGAVAVASEIDRELTFSTSGDAGGGTALSETTLFDIGSIAKPLTGVVVADMALRSEIDLTAPVSDYLSEVRARPAGSVTVEQLLTHRAGLPLRPPSSDGNAAIRQYDDVTGESVLRDFSHCEPAPGSKYEYSNFGYAILGQLLERVSGTDWAAIVKERVLAPLGMDDTVWAYDPRLDRTRLATPMGKLGQTLPERNVSGLVGAGGFYSTSRDMARLMQACLRPSDCAIGDAVGLAMSPHANIESRDDNARHAGFGWQVLNVKHVPMRLVWKNGHGPGNHAFFGVAAASGLGLVALTNHHHRDQFDRAAVAALGQAARSRHGDPEAMNATRADEESS